MAGLAISELTINEEHCLRRNRKNLRNYPDGYTISPDARKEILKRLLKLNHVIHKQEVEQSTKIGTKNTTTKRRKSKKADNQPHLGYA